MTPKADHGEEPYRGLARLNDRVALVTGGDSGIGRAVAIAYAREGAHVLISYLPRGGTGRTGNAPVGRARPVTGEVFGVTGGKMPY